MPFARILFRSWLTLLILGYLSLKAYKVFKLSKNGIPENFDEILFAGLIGALLLSIGAIGELSMEQCPLKHWIVLIVTSIGMGLALYDGIHRHSSKLDDRISQSLAEQEFRKQALETWQRIQGIPGM
jgi:hypothetical protein